MACVVESVREDRLDDEVCGGSDVILNRSRVSASSLVLSSNSRSEQQQHHGSSSFSFKPSSSNTTPSTSIDLAVPNQTSLIQPSNTDRRPPIKQGGCSSMRSATNLAKRITRFSKLLFPDKHIDVSAINKLVTEAYESTSDEYGEMEALEWAEGFQFPPDIADRDLADLHRLGGDLEALVRERHQEMAARGRLSVSSIEAYVDEDDPDRQTLVDLVEGIPILVSEDFVPSGAPAPPRTKYVRLAPCVNRLMTDLHSKGLILMLPTETVCRIPGSHFSETHWALKKGKKCGRPIGDASSRDNGFSLNCDEVKIVVEEACGKIHHPTLRSLMQTVLEFAEGKAWEDLVLWKMDLRGAFTLLFVHPESVKLLAFALTDGLTMLYHTGMFGWTGMPTAFDVISRVLRRAVNKAIRGRAKMYVDDLMGVSHRDDLSHDLSEARRICCGLLGPEAVEDKKTESGRVLDWIGWEINLDMMTVSVSRRNFLKCLYGFASVEEERPVPVRTIERLASWSSRYSTVCRYMKPFSSDLYRSINGRHRNVSINLRTDAPEAIRCIKMWRSFLCLLITNGYEQQRPIQSFYQSAPRFVIEYDASLSGIGVIVYSFNDDRTETEWFALQAQFPYDLGDDSGFQNSVEFIAIIIGVAALAARGVSHSNVHVRGDSRSSLKWSSSDSFRSKRCRMAATCFTALTIQAGINVISIEHIPGELNVRCDSLSRSKQNGTRPEDLGFSRDQIFNISDYPAVENLLRICEPFSNPPDEDDKSFALKWITSMRTCKEIIALGC